MNELASCQANFEAGHYRSSVATWVGLVAGFEASQPASFEASHYLPLVVNQAIPFQSRPAGFEAGWVANRAVTYIYI